MYSMTHWAAGDRKVKNKISENLEKWQERESS